MLPLTEPRREREFDGKSHPDAIPVVLVGLDSGLTQWLFARLCFAARPELFGPVVVFDAGAASSGGLDERACALGETVEAALVDKASKRVVLVGHSVGALVCAHFSDNMAASRGVAVESVVCIACPWHGLPGLPQPAAIREAHLTMARQMPASLQADLGEGSKVLRAIRERRMGGQDSRSVTRFYNLAGGSDALVASARPVAQRLAFWFLLLPHVGHHSILLSQTLWGQALVWLAMLLESRRKAADPGRPEWQNSAGTPLPGGPVPGGFDAVQADVGRCAVRGTPRGGAEDGAQGQ
jgi:pimeloyl-ACP methyl ester carboxylesterase